MTTPCCCTSIHIPSAHEVSGAIVAFIAGSISGYLLSDERRAQEDAAWEEYEKAQNMEGSVDTDYADPVNYDGPFYKNGIRASKHFYDEALNDPDDPVNEDEAWQAYQNGKSYEGENSNIIRYHPKTGVAVVVDPTNGSVITTYRQPQPYHPSSNWKPVR